MRGRGGFTLVEVLVALVVAGLVVAGAYGVLGGAVDARDRLRAARQPVLEGAAMRGALDAWLRSAAPVEGAGPFLGVDGRSGRVPRDAVWFGVPDGGALHRGPHRLHLGIDREGAGLVVEIAAIRMGQVQQPETLAVAPGITGMSLRYRTRRGGRELWLESWMSEDTVPDAVELRLVPAPQAVRGAEGRALPPLLTLPLVVPLRAEPRDEAP
ncbi:MAG TPA: prepilin-type N-terminal cleavage/methylation domain-containing protein [Longimicrobiaceae bacterium]|nr:prepilin-type N-terminal cleavage/methylation domain-containing protein [Longimicrobiaceae bacterium]